MSDTTLTVTLTGDLVSKLGGAGLSLKDLGIHSVLEYGAVGDGVADDGPAINEAIAEAGEKGGKVLIPPAFFRCTTDLVIDQPNVTIEGVGDASVLQMVGAGVVIDGTAGHLPGCGLEKLRVNRTGAPGPAVDFRGAGGGTGPIYWTLRDIQARAAGGTGFRFAGTYIGWGYNVNARGCDIGLDFAPHNGSGSLEVGAFAIHIFGGESQGNRLGVRIENGRHLGFHGYTVEGNAEGGVDVLRRLRGARFELYTESNGGFDVRLGSAGGEIYAVKVDAGHYVDGNKGKVRAVLVHEAKGIRFDTCLFEGYGDLPILIDETIPGAVRGRAEDCYDETRDTDDVVDTNGATHFGRLSLRVSETKPALAAMCPGDAQPRFMFITQQANAGGAMAFGPGGVTPADCIVRRSAQPGLLIFQDDVRFDGDVGGIE